MQHAQQPRKIVVGVVGVDAVGARELRAAVQAVVAKRELPGQRVGQRAQSVKIVKRIDIGRAIGRGEARAVRCRVEGVHRVVGHSRQERVLRRRPDQPPHVVVRETIRPRGIVHLLNLSCQVVDIIYARGVGILLVGQAAQGIIDVLNRLALAVNLRG